MYIRKLPVDFLILIPGDLITFIGIGIGFHNEVIEVLEDLIMRKHMNFINDLSH